MNICDEAGALTWVYHRGNDRVESGTELYGDQDIQDSHNPSVPPRYRVSSGIAAVSDFCIQTC